MGISGDKMEQFTGTIFQHLEELRKVMLRSFLAIFLGTVLVYFFFLNKITGLIIHPVHLLGKDLVIIGVAEGIMTQIKISFFGGIVAASPVVLWQIISFILPALYTHEKRVFFSIFFSAVSLFCAGIAFAYIFVVDLVLKVLLLDFAMGLTPMLSISKYISFFSGFLISFGLVFQIPVVIFFLTWLGVVTPAFLRDKRRYVIVLTFIIAAVLSPGPDVITQIMMAVPMLILYELSIFISLLLTRKKKKAHEAESSEE